MLVRERSVHRDGSTVDGAQERRERGVTHTHSNRYATT
jgi:hypothetical protein